MAKQVINVGTAANDKKGDSLRAAFQKVNTNFTELYTALGINADVNLNLGAFEFTGSVMTTTDSSAIVIDQATTITSNLSVGGDIVPQTANGGDLGSSTLPWRSLYVSNNTIYIGGTAVGVDANGALTTGGTVVGSTPAWNSITGKPTIPTSFDRLVNGDYELVVETDGIISSVAFPERDGGKIYLSGVEIGAVPSDPADTFPYPLVLTSQQGNVRITSNAIQAPRLDWVFDTDGALTIPGDIRSEGNINIDINLGDSTLRRWSFGEDGALTFPDGTSQSTAGGAGGGSTLVNGAYTASLGSTGSLTIPGDIKSNGNINIDINLTDSTLRRWQFGEDGSLILPAGGIIAAPDDQSLTLQVNGLEPLEGGGTGDTFVGGTITMDPVTGLSMSARDLPNSVNYSFAEEDWSTAVWINSEGSGYANFTGAQNLQNWWTSNGSGARAASFIEVSINGGARIPAVYNGTNGSASGVSITTTPTLPPTSPTTITTFEIFYQFKSSIDIDYDNNELLIRAEQTRIQIESTEEFLLRSIGNNPINIQTNYGEGGPGNTWQFGANGGLTLPNGSVIKDTDGYAVAIGNAAGSSNQGSLAVAVGAGAGYTGQGTSAVAIGRDAGGTAQGINAVAIGDAAGGTAQGINAVAIGIQAGYANQAANSIIINATGATLNQTVANTFTVKPVRQSETADAMYYNSSTGEITYAGAFSFSVAADDSTQRLISSGELVKFIGAGGITTASDAEGYITITGTAPSTLVNSTKTLSLGSDGSLTSNGALTLKTPNGIPTSVSNWQGQGGWNQNTYTNLATTGGTGTGLTVDVAANGAGYILIGAITINTPGTGYTAGDVITIDNENSLPGTFTIGVAGTRSWAFGINGHLTLPTGGDIKDSTGTSVLGGGTSIPTVVTTGAVGEGGAAHCKVQFTVASATTVTAVGVTAIGVSDPSKGTVTLSGSPGTGAFDLVVVTNTTPGDTYILMPFATNASGTGYGAPITGAGTNPCLVRGTLITMADMSRVAVENITYCDDILVWDFDLGEFASAKPVWIKKTQTTVVSCLLTFSDDSELRIVGESPKAHRIFNKEAGKFTYGSMPETPIGTTTFNDQGEEITLISKEWIVGEVEFYNVMTDFHMNLFANSILTSMRYNNLYPITDMKFVKDSRTLRTADDYPNVEERLYKGFRLAEQTQSVEEIETHIQWLMTLEVERETECV